MRNLILTLAFAAALTGGSARTTHAQQSRPEQSKVTLNLERVPLKTAFRRFFEGEGLPHEAFTATFPRQYSISPGVPDVPVTLRIHGIGWIYAKWLLVGAAWEQDARVTVIRDGDVYILTGLLSREGDPRPSEFVRLARRETLKVGFERKPLKEAVGALFHGRKARVLVDTEIAEFSVSLQVAEIPAEEAVARLAQAANRKMPGVTYTRAGHYFVIHRSTSR